MNRNKKTHSLKTWPEFWDEVFVGNKTFEVRKNDRDFKIGDVLELKRYCPIEKTNKPFFGESGLKYEIILAPITYVLYGGKFGIEPDFVVLGFDKR